MWAVWYVKASWNPGSGCWYGGPETGSKKPPVSIFHESLGKRCHRLWIWDITFHEFPVLQRFSQTAVRDMEWEATEKEMDGATDTDEDIPIGDSNLVTKSSQCEDRETDDDCEQENPTASFKSQDTPNPATPQDFGIDEAEYWGSAAAKEDTEQASDGLEHDGATDLENSQVQEEDDIEKEQHMNGESGWRSLGGGRRCKLKSSGSFSEQSSQSAFASFQKSNVISSGGRHKQTRRRHHHHQQNRSRRRTGNQLILAFKDILSESLSFWCISCVHMMIEIIVTLTHNCGVCVEAVGVKLYNFGQQLLSKITDVRGMKADASRILKWTKCTGVDVVDKIVRSVKWVKTAALSCFRLFCALAILGSQWAKGVVVRLGGERGKRYWTSFQESRFWKWVVSLLERVQRRFKRDARAPPYTHESPGRAGRGQSGQELERLLALAEIPENELDPFTVLGVEVHASEAELKKAYRQLAVQVCVRTTCGWVKSLKCYGWMSEIMTNTLHLRLKVSFLLMQPFPLPFLFQVHPDKNKHPRAGEAFKVLRAAWDIVSNPETRREYELWVCRNSGHYRSKI